MGKNEKVSGRDAAIPRYDLLILGAGPAGAAAAIRGAADARVALLDSAAFPRPRACAGWIGPAGVQLLEELGITEKAAGATKFSGMHLHAWDLKKHVDLKDADLRGWLVDRSVFDAALLRRAQKAGAEVHVGCPWRSIQFRDDAVQLLLEDERTLSARVLIIADGCGSAAAAAARLPAAGHRPGAATAMLLSLPAVQKGPSRLDVILGSQRSGLLATLTRAPHGVAFAMLSRLAPDETRAQFERLVSAAQSAELLPRGLPAPVVLQSPAGMALDLETHVGKRCLLIGEAGGFVSAFSNEGIYPSMRSGCLAAEIAGRAVRAPVAQDELSAFDAAWRIQFSDSLRMPNTDLSLLVPLVFGNAQMSQRVARAFLLGQPF